ncbi:TonB-dependent receptor [Marinoscillum sp. 108]|uniref:TonB-dependent receptor n=1 Tax=Marinoscillum sp. 108 TaxID=2653151 RepID=UPI0012F3E5E2|nr:TonB-dependent receptor [Marinoscillum sp. 108]VXD18577.1 TonB-dependent receptor [Marinoscillum sp. 108]
MKTKFLMLTILFLIVSNAYSQTQVIRGKLIDTDSKSPLIGATIRVLGSDPVLGNVTDINGEFRIDRVPLGRVNLMVTYIGYEDRVIPNVLVTAAKEVIVNVSMIESVEKLAEVVVTADRNKGEVRNEMALVSARSFSVEETQRYAGAFSDPARMVSTFAGVAGDAEGDNNIVVRGNSPKGLLWKLEGVEIPNPNHFASEGSTGGPVNALNSNMLDNSDFYSGAFAPEYGNALSGIMDIRFKKGNNQTREYTAGASTLGLEFTAEGPFKKGYNGSYIANYRYSSLQLLSDLGILDFGGIPKYQDASFNVNLPINRKHTLALFGLGGKSKIQSEEELDNGDPAYKGEFNSDLGILGLSHVYFISDKAYLKNIATLSATSLYSVDDLVDDNKEFYNAYNSDISKTTLRTVSTFNYKISAQHKVETGVIFSDLSYDATANEYNYDHQTLENVLSDQGGSQTIQAFTSWKYRVNEDWTITSGIHYLYFDLSNAHSVEPRAALKWQMTPRQSLNAGYGLHSKVESISTYLAKTSNDQGQLIQPNKNLTPSKAHHWVLGYDLTLSPQAHLKAEVYYQHLFDIPIENLPASTFSLLNASDSYINRPLVNDGTGRNYGLELTYERFFHQGLYYMGTLSLFQSLYTAMDGAERSTAYNGNYMANFIGGKEFNIGGPEKNKVFFVNAKVALLGGGRYTPLDLERSREQGHAVYHEDKPFSQKGDDVFFVNLTVGTRKNKKNTTREFKIDVQNVTNNQAVIREYYLEPTGEIERGTQLSLIPNIVYSIKF